MLVKEGGKILLIRRGGDWKTKEFVKRRSEEKEGKKHQMIMLVNLVPQSLLTFRLSYQTIKASV